MLQDLEAGRLMGSKVCCKLLERLHGCVPVVAAMDELMVKSVPRAGGTHVHKMRLMSEQVDGRSRRVLGSSLAASQWQLF